MDAGRFRLESLEPRLLLSGNGFSDFTALPQLQQTDPSAAVTEVILSNDELSSAQDDVTARYNEGDLESLFGCAQPVEETDDLPHQSRAPFEDGDGMGDETAVEVGVEIGVEKAGSDPTAAATETVIRFEPAARSAPAVEGVTAPLNTPAIDYGHVQHERVETLVAAEPPPQEAGATFVFHVQTRGSDLTLRRTEETDDLLVLIDEQCDRIVAAMPFAHVNRVSIHGADTYDDRLTIDFGEGWTISDGISYSGGAGGFDTLAIVSSNRANVVFAASGPESGIVQLNSMQISYDGLEPVDLRGMEPEADFVFVDDPGASNEIRLIDYGTPTDGYLQIDSNGTGGFEEVYFPVPTRSLTIDASDGNDTVIVAATNAELTVPLLISGGEGDDRLFIDATLSADAFYDGGSGTDSIIVTEVEAADQPSSTVPGAGVLTVGLTYSATEYVETEFLGLVEHGLRSGYFANLQDTLNAAVLNEPLPLVGSGLASSSAGQIAARINGELADFQPQPGDNGRITVETVETALAEALAGLLQGDVRVLGEDGDPHILFQVSLAGTELGSCELDLTLGDEPFLQPLIGLEDAVNVTTAWTLELTIGVRKVDGKCEFFIDTAAEDELLIDVHASIDPAWAAVGRLGVFSALFQQDTGGPQAPAASVFEGSYAIDLVDGDNRIIASELDTPMVSSEMDGAGKVHLDADAAFIPDLYAWSGGAVTGLTDAARRSLFNISLRTDLTIDYETRFLTSREATVRSDKAPVVAFETISMDMGEFFDGFVRPAFSVLKPNLEDVQEPMSFLTEPVPIISDLVELVTGGEVLLVPCGSAAARFVGEKGLRKLGALGQDDKFRITVFGLSDAVEPTTMMNRVVDAVNNDTIPTAPDLMSLFQDLGSFSVQLAGDMSVTSSDPVPDLLEQFRQQTFLDARVREFFTHYGGCLRFPALEDPSMIFSLMRGETAGVELLRVDAELDVGLELEFSIPVWQILYVDFFWTMGGTLDLDLWYDGKGIEDLGGALDYSGDLENLSSSLVDNAALLRNGFAFDDHNPDGSYTDGNVSLPSEVFGRASPDGESPEATMYEKLAVGGSLGLYLGVADLKAGVRGYLQADIHLDLNDLPEPVPEAPVDPPHRDAYPENPSDFAYDGIVRLGERDVIGWVDPGALWNKSGDVRIGLELYVRVSLLGIPLFRRSFTLVETTLYNYDLSMPDDEQILEGSWLSGIQLGSVDSEGELTIFTGPRAGQRNVVPFADDEFVRIESLGLTDENDPDAGETLVVTFQDFYRSTFEGVKRIVADGGYGHDVFLVSESVGVDADIVGGDGDDYLAYLGSGGAVLYGGNGGDVLQGGEFGVMLSGGPGDDSLRAGGGDDVLNGGDGDDELQAGPGNDVLFGGGGNDRLSGGDGADELWGQDGDDILDGNSGPDMLAGGTGSDQYVWTVGPDADTIVEGPLADSDVVTIAGSDEHPDDLIVLRGIPNGAGRHVEIGTPWGPLVFDGIERLAVAAGAGSDRVIVDDLTGTGLVQVVINLKALDESPNAGGDAVVYLGSTDPARPDRITAEGAAAEIVRTTELGDNSEDTISLVDVVRIVDESAAEQLELFVINSSPDRDRLVIDGRNGDDRLSVASGQDGVHIRDLISVTLTGGDGDDEFDVVYSDIDVAGDGGTDTLTVKSDGFQTEHPALMSFDHLVMDSTQYVEDGLTLTTTTGSMLRRSDDESASVYPADPDGDVFTVTMADGSPFAANTLDVRLRDATVNVQTLEITGLRSDGTQASRAFVIDRPVSDFETLTLGPEFTSIVSLSWRPGLTVVDNITANRPVLTLRGDGGSDGSIDIRRETPDRVRYTGLEALRVHPAADTTGTDTHVLGSISGTLEIKTGGGPDGVYLHGLQAAATTVLLNGDGDGVTLGDRGSLALLGGSLAILGADGRDRIVYDATADICDRTSEPVAVTSDRVSGLSFAPGAEVVFDSAIDEIVLLLGSGDDTVHVGASGQDVFVHGGAGYDAVTVGLLPGIASGVIATFTVEEVSLLDHGTAPSAWELSDMQAPGHLPLNNSRLFVDGRLILKTHEAAQSAVYLGPADGVVSVLDVNHETWINTGDGDDEIRVGCSDVAAYKTLDDLAAPLVIAGGGGTDTIALIDVEDGTAGTETAVVSGSWVSGFGMAESAAVKHEGCERMEVIASDPGGYDIAVQSTVIPTALELGGGDDRVEMYAGSAVVAVNLGAGDDRFVVRASAAPVFVEGGVGEGDVLEVDATSNAAGLTGSLSDAAGGINSLLSIAGLIEGVTFAGAEEIHVGLGLGSDTFDIDTSYDRVLAVSGGGGDDRVRVHTLGGPTDFSGGDGIDSCTIVFPAVPTAEQAADLTFHVETLIADNRSNTAGVDWTVEGGMLSANSVPLVPTDGSDAVRILGGTGHDTLEVEELSGPVSATVDGSSVELERGSVVLEPAGFVHDETLGAGTALGSLTDPIGVCAATAATGDFVYVRDAEGYLTVFELGGGGLEIVQVMNPDTPGLGGTAGSTGDLAISPDGAFVFTCTGSENRLASFRRDPATGMLSLIQVLQQGVDGVNGLSGVSSISAGPDGAHLYAAAGGQSAISVFDIHADGRLSTAQVLGGYGGAEHVRAGGDATRVYATAGQDVLVFRRDPDNGTLAFAYRTGPNGTLSRSPTSPDDPDSAPRDWAAFAEDLWVSFRETTEHTWSITTAGVNQYRYHTIHVEPGELISITQTIRTWGAGYNTVNQIRLLRNGRVVAASPTNSGTTQSHGNNSLEYRAVHGGGDYVVESRTSSRRIDYSVWEVYPQNITYDLHIEQEALPGTSEVTRTGTLSDAEDADFYRISASPGAVLTVSFVGGSLTSPTIDLFGFSAQDNDWLEISPTLSTGTTHRYEDLAYRGTYYLIVRGAGSYEMTVNRAFPGIEKEVETDALLHANDDVASADDLAGTFRPAGDGSFISAVTGSLLPFDPNLPPVDLTALVRNDNDPLTYFTASQSDIPPGGGGGAELAVDGLVRGYPPDWWLVFEQFHSVNQGAYCVASHEDPVTSDPWYMCWWDLDMQEHYQLTEIQISDIQHLYRNTRSWIDLTLTDGSYQWPAHVWDLSTWVPPNGKYNTDVVLPEDYGVHQSDFVSYTMPTGYPVIADHLFIRANHELYYGGGALQSYIFLGEVQVFGRPTQPDLDFFRFQAAPGDTLTADLTAGTLRDPYLTLYDRDGTELCSDDNSGPGAGAALSFNGFAYAGDYYLSAGSADPYGYGEYTLTTQITPVVPDTTTSIITPGPTAEIVIDDPIVPDHLDERYAYLGGTGSGEDDGAGGAFGTPSLQVFDVRAVLPRPRLLQTIRDLGIVEDIQIGADSLIYAAHRGTDGCSVSVFRRLSDGTLTMLDSLRVFENAEPDVVGGARLSLAGERIHATDTSAQALVVLRFDGQALFEETRSSHGDFTGTVLSGIDALQIDPGGAHVYGINTDESSLLVLNASDVSGIETYTDGAGGVDGLGGANALAVSADGTRVYVGAPDDGMIGVFDRDHACGELTFVGSLPVDETLFGQVHALAVSPDGEVLYAGFDDLVAAFPIADLSDPSAAVAGAAILSTGAVVTSLTVGPATTDGAAVYVATPGHIRRCFSPAGAAPLSGPLQVLRAPSGGALAVSADGEFLYACSPGDNSVRVYRELGDRLAEEPVQHLREGFNGVHGIVRPVAVAVSPLGDYLYVVGSGSDSLAVFQRLPETGTLRLAQVYRNSGDLGLMSPTSVTAGPNGTLYVGSSEGPGSMNGGAAVFVPNADVLPPCALDVGFENIEELTLTTGAFQDRVRLQRTPEVETTVIDTGAGADEVRLARLAGIIHVHTGSEDDVVDIRSDGSNGSDGSDGSAGELLVDTGEGNDEVTVGGVGAGMSITIATNEGADVVSLLRVEGPMSVRTGPDGDTVEVRCVTESGGLVVETGDGDDSLLVAGASILSTVRADGGTPGTAADSSGDALLFDPAGRPINAWEIDEAGLPTGPDLSVPPTGDGAVRADQTGAGLLVYRSFEAISDETTEPFSGTSVTANATGTAYDGIEGGGIVLMGTVVPATNTVITSAVWDVGTSRVFVGADRLVFDGTTYTTTIELTWSELQALGVDDGDRIYDVSLRAASGRTTLAEDTVPLAIRNRAPSISALGPESCVVGDACEITFSVSDPGADTVAGWEIDWGDGTTADRLGSDAVGARHIYADTGTFFLTLTAIDEDSGDLSTYPAVPGYSVNIGPIDVSAPVPAVSHADGTAPITMIEGTELALSATVPAGFPDYYWTVGNGAETLGPPDGSFTLTWEELNACGIQDDGTYDVSVRTQYSTSSARGTTSLVVVNAAPSARLVGSTVHAVDGGAAGAAAGAAGTPLIPEGGSAAVGFAGPDDPSPADCAAGFTYSFDFGADGSYEIVESTEATAGVPDEVVDDDGSIVVRGLVHDKDGGTGSAEISFLVYNVPPAFDELNVTAQAKEGVNAYLTGTVTEPGVRDVVELLIAWGDGSAPERVTIDAPNGAFAVPHLFADDGVYEVDVTARDGDGGECRSNVTAAVENTVPTIVAAGAPAITEGDWFTLYLASSDPGEDRITDWSIDWGDGTVETADGDVSWLSHRYADDSGSEPDGAYVIRVTAVDEDTTWAAPYTATRYAFVDDSFARFDVPGNTAEHYYYLTPDDTDWASAVEYAESVGGTLVALGSKAEQKFVDDTYLSSVGAPERLWTGLVDEQGDGRFSWTTGEPVSFTAWGLGEPANPSAVPGWVVLQRAGEEAGPVGVGFDEIAAGSTEYGESGFRLSTDGAGAALIPAEGLVGSGVCANDATDTFTLRSENGGIFTLESLDLYSPSEAVLRFTAGKPDGSSVTMDLAVSGSASRVFTTYQLSPALANITSLAWRPGPTVADNLSLVRPRSIWVFTSEPEQNRGIIELESVLGLPSVEDDTMKVVVTNVAPHVRIDGPGAATEGSGCAIRVHPAVDPGNDTVERYIVDWGDGTLRSIDAPEPDENGNRSGALLTHTYADGDSVYDVSITVVDEDGAYHMDAAAHITVSDVAPILTINGDQRVTEGQEYTLTIGPPVDPGEDTFEYRVDWGDGTVDDWSTRQTASHIYYSTVAGDVVTISVDIRDPVEMTENNSAAVIMVEVVDAPPTIKLAGHPFVVDEQGVIQYTVREGEPFTLELDADQVYDPGDPSTPVSVDEYTIQWGDGTAETIAHNSEFSHAYREGSFNVTIVVDMLIGDTRYPAAATMDVNVENAPPEISSEDLILNAAVIEEGGEVLLNGTFADPGLSDTHSVEIDWGDGTVTALVVEQSDRAFAAAHQYLDDEPSGTTTDECTITVTVKDDDGASAEAAVAVAVVNGEPEITSFEVDPAPATIGETVTLTFAFSDPGKLDQCTASIDWGDGTVEHRHDLGPEGSVAASHQYLIGGPHTITVTVVDDDCGESVRSTTVVVSGVAVVDGVLYVAGTNGDDSVRINGIGRERIAVHADFSDDRPERWVFDAHEIHSIVVYLGDGADRAHVAGNIDVGVSMDGGNDDDVLIGGRGDDALCGGAGDDLLIGGRGDDTLSGGPGNDILIGGRGDDELCGGSGDDLVVEGRRRRFRFGTRSRRHRRAPRCGAVHRRSRTTVRGNEQPAEPRSIDLPPLAAARSRSNISRSARAPRHTTLIRAAGL